jgi:hypothetical protein
LVKTDIRYLYDLLRLRRPQLDAAREAARVVAQQVDDDLADILGRDLPVGAFLLVAARERGGDRPGIT